MWNVVIRSLSRKGFSPFLNPRDLKEIGQLEPIIVLYSGGGRCTVGEVRTRASDENGGFGKTMTWSNGRKDLAFFHFCIGWLTARFLVRSCDLQVVQLADPPRQLIGPTFICSLPFIFSNRKLKN